MPIISFLKKKRERTIDLVLYSTIKPGRFPPDLFCLIPPGLVKIYGVTVGNISKIIVV